MLTNVYTFNETYNRPAYVLATSSETKSLPSLFVSIRRTCAKYVRVVSFQLDAHFLHSKSPNNQKVTYSLNRTQFH